MEGSSEGFAVPVVLFVLVLGAAMGTINGLLIVITRVPDIVVTLAMLFVWEGVALLILKAPGGAAAEWLKGLMVGQFIIPWIPKALGSSRRVSRRCVDTVSPVALRSVRLCNRQ